MIPGPLTMERIMKMEISLICPITNKRTFLRAGDHLIFDPAQKLLEFYRTDPGGGSIRMQGAIEDNKILVTRDILMILQLLSIGTGLKIIERPGHELQRRHTQVYEFVIPKD